jgi:hypothetical protein
MSYAPSPLALAVRDLVQSGFDVKVTKRGRTMIQAPLFPSGPEAENAVNLVLSSPAAEVKRMIPRRPRGPRRPRPSGGRR